MNQFNENEGYRPPTYVKEEPANKPVLDQADEIIEMDDLDLDGFQVVRREFFAHMYEPSCTFNNCKFNVNTACLRRFPTSDFAQVLVNRENKILALRPCPEGSRDSFQWATTGSNGKRKPKPITCRLFFAKIVSLMGWDPKHRYKLLGQLVHSNDEYLIAFDLTATEVYQRSFPEGEKPKTSRVPVFPADWQDQFGMPFSEHKQSMQINIVDGYAVYTVKDTTETGKSEVNSNQLSLPVHTLDGTGGGNE